MWRMTVKDLIAKLQEFDPDLPVVMPLRPKGVPRFKIGVQVDGADVVYADAQSGKYIIRDAYKEREKAIDEVEVLLLSGW